jgi:hypothetical protein
VKHGRNEASLPWRTRIIAVCSYLLLSATLLRCAQGDNDQALASGAAEDGAVAQADAGGPAEDARPTMREEDVTAPAPDAQTEPEAGAPADDAGQNTNDDAAPAPDAQEAPDAETNAQDGAQDSGIDAASTPDAGEDVDTGTFIDASDAASAPDAYEAGTSVDASDAAADDSGVDASTSGTCAGIPAWVEGTTASVVTNLGEKYTCITPGWCSLVGTSAVLAYEPGTGSAWQEAWKDDGPCQ